MRDFGAPAVNTFFCLSIIAGSFVVSYALTWVMRYVAPIVGMLDHPNTERKLQSQATPLLGGLAIYLSLLLCLLGVAAACYAWFAESLRFGNDVTLLFISAALCCLIGLWDDCSPMRASTKFFLVLAACLPFAIFCEPNNLIYLFGMSLNIGILSIPFTAAWLVSCANIFNLLDGSDGVASSVGLVTVATAAVLSAVLGHVDLLVLGLILAGTLVGFLFHNAPPAKIYLGDSGSLLIGFLAGAMALKVTKVGSSFALIPALVLFGIPTLDAAMAILRRVLSKRSIGMPDLGHIHHCLMFRGFSKVRTLLTITMLSLLVAALAMVSVQLQSDMLAMAVSCTIVAVLARRQMFCHKEFAMLQQWLGGTRGAANVARKQKGDVASISATVQEENVHTSHGYAATSELVKIDNAHSASQRKPRTTKLPTARCA